MGLNLKFDPSLRLWERFFPQKGLGIVPGLRVKDGIARLNSGV